MLAKVKENTILLRHRMQFSNVVGQAHIKDQLLQLVAQNRVPHAMLLNGQKGNGALPLCLAFVAYLMCEEKKETDSCGECSNCQKLQKMQHIDVHFSFPTVSDSDKKIEALSQNYIADFRNMISQAPYATLSQWLLQMDAGNKQPNISAKECRAIIQKMQLRSFEGGLKFQIIWLPEYLGKEGNILLKLIEEPPPKTILILVTENYEALLSTIQSRVQLVQLAPLTGQEIIAALQAKNIEPSKAQAVARLCDGDYNKALQLASQQPDDYCDILKQWLNALYTNNGVAIAGWSTTMAAEGKDTQKQFLNYVIQMMELLLRIRYGGQNDLLLQDEEAVLLQKLNAKQVSPQQAHAISNECAHTQDALERNANAKIVWLSLSLTAKDIFAGKALSL